MDVFAVLKRHSDVALGTAVGVLLAPKAVGWLGGLFSLGQYQNVVLSGGAAIATLALFGKKKPMLVVPIASVLLVQAAVSLFPDLQF